jgi:hypothetical protein
MSALQPTPSRGGARRERRASLLLVLVGAWVVVPRTIQTLTAPKYRAQAGVENAPYTALAAVSVRLLLIAMIGLCALVMIEAVRDRPRRGVGALVLLLLPWCYLQLRDGSLGFLPTFSEFAYPAVVIALWALRPAFRQLEVIGYAAGAVSLLSILIGAFLPLKGIFRHADGEIITPDKALLPGGLLVGIFTHGNVLGQFLILGLPMVALIRHVAIRNVFLFTSVVALLWTAARSALLTLVILAVLIPLIALVPTSWRGVPARLCLIGAYCVAAVVPFTTNDPVAFTNRGYVWIHSLAAWPDHRWIGSGSQFYTELARSSAALGPTVAHGHNQLVQLLMTGGVILAVLVTLLLGASIRVAVRWATTTSLFPFAYLLALGGMCILEVSFAFVDNGFLFPVFVVPMAVILFADPEDRELSHVPRRAWSESLNPTVESRGSAWASPS